MSSFSDSLYDILETLAAEAFIFGNFALGKAVGVSLPDDNHELPPVDKAKQAIKQLVADEIIGKNDYAPGEAAPDLINHNRLVRDGLRHEQRERLELL